MRALVLHGPGNYKFETDWPQPELKKGWVLVKVAYAGVCGSDLPRFAVTGSYHHPMILGHEFSGTIAGVFSGSMYKGGERVAVLPIIPCGACAGCARHEPFHCSNYQFLGSRNDGGFAEYCLVPEANLFVLPDNLDLRIGAFIEPIAVALHVVRRSGFTEGSTAFVFGAGAIGLLIGLWLKVFGAKRVVIADIRSESLSIAGKIGFNEVYSPGHEEFKNENGFDAVFEAAGAQAALLSAVEKTGPRGTLTVVGRDTKDTVFPLKIFEQLMRKEITLKGCWGYNMNEEHEFVHRMLADGRFPVRPLITQEISLEKAPQMIKTMIERKTYYCKVLIRI